MRLVLIIILICFTGNGLPPVWPHAGGLRPVITTQNVNDLVSRAQLEHGSLGDPVWAPDGTLVFVTGSLGIWRFDVRHLHDQPPQILEQYRGPLAISPDGVTAASLNDEGKIVLWNVQTGELDRVFYDASLRLISINELAFSSDGQYLMMGYGGGGTVRPAGGVTVWNAQTGQEVASLRRVVDDVNAVAFSPIGTQLAVGGYNGLARWDTESWQALPMTWGSGIYDISYSSDGRWLAS